MENMQTDMGYKGLWIKRVPNKALETRNSTMKTNGKNEYLLFISPILDNPKSVSFIWPSDVIKRLERKKITKEVKFRQQIKDEKKR